MCSSASSIGIANPYVRMASVRACVAVAGSAIAVL